MSGLSLGSGLVRVKVRVRVKGYKFSEFGFSEVTGV